MTKKIDLNERLARSQCGCGHAAKEKSDAHAKVAEHAGCGDAASPAGSAHLHQDGCCGGSHGADKTRQHHASSSSSKGAES